MPASAQLNCSVVESLGNGMARDIVADINRSAAMSTTKINRRKSLRFERMDSIRFQGCRATLRGRVTLLRKVRRDASGPVVISATVKSFNLRAKQLCFSNPRVKSLKLSRTTRLGERVYGWVAKLWLRRNGCFTG